jgi:hypothetical protein
LSDTAFRGFSFFFPLFNVFSDTFWALPKGESKREPSSEDEESRRSRFVTMATHCPAFGVSVFDYRWCGQTLLVPMWKLRRMCCAAMPSVQARQKIKLEKPKQQATGKNARVASVTLTVRMQSA